MWSLLLRAALSYFESHPEQVQALLEHGVQAGIHALKAHNVAQAAK